MNKVYGVTEVTLFEVEGEVRRGRLLRRGEDGQPRTLDGQMATPVTRYVVTADGQQIGTHYATRAEAEREAARCQRAREEVGPYDDTP